ncbi:MAG: phosphoribosylamine--glycine ligase [Chitinophagales bacterium]
MKVLLLGSGGREHAFAWKISQSPLCAKLYIAPGNGGTGQHGENVALGVNDFDAIEKFVLDNVIDMVVVGPEDPLVNGIYDYFQSKPQLQHIPVIGPSQKGATLEGSKAFAKAFMMRNEIPTAAYREFTAANLQEGLDYLDKQHPPIVLKADGLAAGKGVLICTDKEDAKKELSEMIANAKFGKASATVVIEQFLKGIEFSVFVLTDGKNYKLLPNAKDYKRIGEGDTGLNTGGMGCISPVPIVNEGMMKKVEEKVIQPTIEGLQKEGIIYNGFIYFGLIAVDGEPYVIEYNCRMGDPETEIVLPRIKSDLLQHFVGLAEGRLQNEQIDIDHRAMATVIVASGGYPGDYEKGKEITGIVDVTESIVFHAGTKNENGKTLTNGGRVLAVSSYGNDIHEAVAKSNASINKVHFDGMYYRKDIGWEFK